MPKGNNKKSNRVLREFCIRLFIFSCKIFLRALDSYNRVIILVYGASEKNEFGN